MEKVPIRIQDYKKVTIRQSELKNYLFKIKTLGKSLIG